MHAPHGSERGCSPQTFGTGRAQRAAAPCGGEAEAPPAVASAAALKEPRLAARGTESLAGRAVCGGRVSSRRQVARQFVTDQQRQGKDTSPGGWSNPETGPCGRRAWPRAWGRRILLDFLCRAIVTDFFDMAVSVCVCVCAHTYVCMCVCAGMRMCARVCACMCARVHVHVHVHVGPLSCTGPPSVP